ncbi:MAG TPA: glycosyl hydrolase family 17 protein [Saprospiraceae bacterium]|nr:glycosyl hydrolase family 17 protein [Saprospiraceae bacterium]
MSYRYKKRFSVTQRNFADQSPEQLSDLLREVLEQGLHGLCYSAYEEGQEPGDILSIEQIRRRMAIIAPYIGWIRSFSCVEGNELIPVVAREKGLKTLVGAWLSDDKELNEKEIEGLIKLAKDGQVDIAAVGNEVLYREELEEEELLEYIARVREALPGEIPVGYVDAYYEFRARPRITEACDVILANCYPYWEGSHIDYSLIHMQQMYYSARDAGNGKPVIITETGWPSQGTGLDQAEPSRENAIRYFLNAQQWAAEQDIDMFYFSSFDEAWKVGAEGDVGAYWGIWDKDGKLKF